MASSYSLNCTLSFSFIVPLAVNRSHSLSFFVSRCTTLCHSLSLAVPFAVPLLVIRCQSLYHSSPFDVQLVCLFINNQTNLIRTLSLIKHIFCLINCTKVSVVSLKNCQHHLCIKSSENVGRLYNFSQPSKYQKILLS